MTQLGCLTKKGHNWFLSHTLAYLHTYTYAHHTVHSFNSAFDCNVPSKRQKTSSLLKKKKKQTPTTTTTTYYKKERIENVLVFIQLLLLRTRIVGVSPYRSNFFFFRFYSVSFVPFCLVCAHFEILLEYL